MGSKDKKTKQDEKLLDFVYNEIVRPAWKNWLIKYRNGYTIAMFDVWTENLFTEESKVQIIIKSSAAHFIKQEIVYCVVLGVIDSNMKVQTMKQFWWAFRYRQQ